MQLTPDWDQRYRNEDTAAWEDEETAATRREAEESLMLTQPDRAGQQRPYTW